MSVVSTIVIWIAAIFIGWFIFVEIILRLIKHFIHLPIPPLFTRFIDNPIRRKIFPPERVVDHLEIREGMAILEIGPGSGFYTFETARRAGFSGDVYAMDIAPSVLDSLEQKIRRRSVTNITAKIASADELPLPEKSMDRVFMVGVISEIPDKKKALLEIKRVLKDNGLLAIGELLPDPDYPRRKTVIRWCKATDFELADGYGSVFHYVLTFKKSTDG